jgi:hypothetical protein
VEKVHPFNLPQEATAEISSDLDTQAEILYAKLLSKKGMPLASLRKISTPLGDIMTYKDIIVKFGGQTLHWVATRQVSKYKDTWAPLEEGSPALIGEVQYLEPLFLLLIRLSIASWEHKSRD